MLKRRTCTLHITLKISTWMNDGKINALAIDAVVRSTFGKYSRSKSNNNNNNNKCNKNKNRCTTRYTQHTSQTTPHRIWLWWRVMGSNNGSSFSTNRKVYAASFDRRTDRRSDGQSVVAFFLSPHCPIFTWSLFILRTIWSKMNATGDVSFFSLFFFGCRAECRWCRMMISWFIFVADNIVQCFVKLCFHLFADVIFVAHPSMTNGLPYKVWVINKIARHKMWAIFFALLFVLNIYIICWPSSIDQSLINYEYSTYADHVTWDTCLVSKR